MKKIVNWNCGEVGKHEVFHFKNSLRPFIEINNVYNEEGHFLDIDKEECYSLDDLMYEGLEFYTDDSDDNFMGVEIDGKVKWVS